MGRTCLLTGATGFLGRYLQEGLSSEYDIYTLSRKDVSGGRNFRFDLNDAKLDFGQKPFDLVVHAAGHAHIVPKTEEESSTFLRVNAEGTMNLLRKIEYHPPQDFVFISSVSVYGLNEGQNVTEDAPLHAQDPYGRSKIEAEKMVRDWCKQHKVTCTILRLPLIAGKDAPGNLGRMVSSIRKGRYARIGKGQARKSMVLASDVSQAILAARGKGGTFNLTDGIHPTFVMLEDAITNALGKGKVRSIPYFPIAAAASIGSIGEALLKKRMPISTRMLKKITATLTFSDEKARKEIGWQPHAVIEAIPNLVK